MRICLLVLTAVLGTACPVLATDWVFLIAHDDRSVSLYYDRHAVRVSGDMVRVRLKRVFAEDEGRELALDHNAPESVAYVVERVVLDCARHRFSRSEATWYGISGKVLDRTVAAPGVPWRRMEPEGFGEALCAALD